MNNSTPNVRITGISLGAGLTFLTLDNVQTALFPFVRTRRATRALLAALSVPILNLPGGEVVEIHTLRTALKYVSRMGQPDFAAPGSKPLRKNRHASTRAAGGRKRPYRTQLTPEELLASNALEVVCSELYMHALTSMNAAVEDIRSLSAEIARRMVVAGQLLAAPGDADAKAKEVHDRTWKDRQEHQASDDDR